jgi:phosphoribosyl-ATP pyrophosphohydrolase
MTLTDLYTVVCHRRENPSPQSYTTRLMSEGEDEILKKIGEEAIEVLLAAKSQGRQRLVEEVSDLAYHVLVLLSYRGIPLEDIQGELTKRHNPRP